MKGNNHSLPQSWDYDHLIKLTQTNAEPAEVELFIKEFLTSPQFHRLQVFSNQAIRILDTSTMKYLFISESVKELTGYTPQEIEEGGILFAYRRTHLIDLFRLAKATFLVKAALKKLTVEEKMRARFSYDARFTTKQGTIKKVLQNCHILKLNQENDPLIVLFASTDITAYKLDNRMNYCLSLYDEINGFTSLLKDSISEEECPLSLREREVLSRTARGMSTKAIADSLNLSLETVKTHRKNMLQKANTKNTIELVRLAIAKNWID